MRCQEPSCQGASLRGKQAAEEDWRRCVACITTSGQARIRIILRATTYQQAPNRKCVRTCQRDPARSNMTACMPLMYDPHARALLRVCFYRMRPIHPAINTHGPHLQQQHLRSGQPRAPASTARSAIQCPQPPLACSPACTQHPSFNLSTHLQPMHLQPSPVQPHIQI